MTVKKVAIACQGGGTHADFTWGMLTQILETKLKWVAADAGERFDVTAISGTSAGALCALATWYGLAPNTADPECGTTERNPDAPVRYYGVRRTRSWRDCRPLDVLFWDGLAEPPFGERRSGR